MLPEDQGAGLNALHDQGTQQQSGGGVAGDAQGQQGDDGAAHGGVVGRFRGHHAVDDAGAELLGVLGLVLGDGIGQHVGRSGADTGQDAQTDADQGAADAVGYLREELLQAEPKALDVKVGDDGGLLAGRGLVAILRRQQDLRDGEHAHQHGEDVEAAVQGVGAEGIAAHRVDGSQAHCGQHQTDDAGDQALDQVLLGQGDDQCQGEDGDGEILPGAELDGDVGQGGRDTHQGQQAEDGAHKGEHDAHAQGLARLTLPGQGGAVQTGGHRGRGAGDVQQDGGDQAAGDAADVQGHQGGLALGGRHAIGHGQEHGDGHGGGQSGDTAEQDANQGAHKDPHHSRGVEQDGGNALHDHKSKNLLLSPECPWEASD